MTLPPQGHPQHELRRRIADCRERLRRARTGQNRTEHAAAAQVHAANDEPASDETDDAPARRPKRFARRSVRR
ncbi:MAG: hypothetical protein ACJ74W_06170 [Pyrinomonadaceae bacterium]